MRKRISCAIALSLCVVCFGAFAANERGRARTQNTTNQNASTAAVSARAATRNTPKTQNVGGNVSARAATKQNVGTGVVSARAGATQKVINTGTKVASATTNTNVPQECQDAFYGCMDAFCMLDNASGGRCQCSDRIVELDKALEDILKLDEQTYLMATEGVERIQMGEGEEQIMARVKAAAEKTINQDKEDNKKKARTLDLSAWNNNIFNDTDDLFESSAGDTLNTFADKKGDDLYKASAKMCATQISNACKSYDSMMQLIYAQRIKSDCIAYENSLKAQKSQSQQKLQTAQKALRDAALDEYKNQNKYATTGECVVAFTRCMQTTAECGEDYTGCVTLAAKENVKGNTSGKKAKQTTVKGAVAGADITLAATTMEQLLAKKEICASVTKQCVNANRNDAVWTVFLRNAAPALKSAEDIAEQRLRMDCIPSMAKCFQEACKSNFGSGDSYDMCLSNPETYKSLCKIQLEPCLEATGGTYDKPTDSTLWNGLVAMLNSMKVDACTKEVKDCLTADTACGEDYSGCVGLSTDAIIDLCPVDKLTACMKDNKNDETVVRDYVAQVAQGLALNIDNNMLLTCQAALDAAVINACGDKDSCPNAALSTNAMTDLLGVAICEEGEDGECHTDPYAFTKEQILGGHVEVKITNRPNLSAIDYFQEDVAETDRDLFKESESMDESTKKMVAALNSAWNSKIAQIESDPKVDACINGRDIKKYRGSGTNANLEKSTGFKNLSQSVKIKIANRLMNLLWENYDEAIEKLNKEQVPVLAQKLADVVADAVANEEAKIDLRNSVICNAKAIASEEEPSIHGCTSEYTTISAKYDSTTNICSVTTTEYKRHLNGKKENTSSCDCGALCKFVVEVGPKVDNQQMPMYSRFNSK